MLSSYDRAIVERDPSLAGLPILLDDDALSAWLSEHLAAPCRASVRRIRYKPATSCVAALQIQYAAGGTKVSLDALAKTYTAESAAKIDKSVSHAPEDAVLALHPSLRLLVTTLAGDRDVTALRKLADPQRRHPMLKRLLPDYPATSDARLLTLRHNPERRWVGLLEPAGQAAVVLRAYRSSETQLHRHFNPYALLSRGSPPTPALLGISRRDALVAVEWVEGTVLSHRLGELSDFVSAGEALAQLHERPHMIDRLRPATPTAQALAVLNAGRQIAQLMPELSDQAAKLAHLLATDLGKVIPRDSVLHGDFSADQLVLANDGTVRLIDLDSLCNGDPAIDLGSARAASLRHVEASSDTSIAEAALEALLAGYESRRPLPTESLLALHTAAQLIRRAPEPFRDREPEWPRRMTDMLAMADHHFGRYSGTAGRQ
jgi:aminoglycoside phosphotransferase (APT) family kinase protein